MRKIFFAVVALAFFFCTVPFVSAQNVSREEFSKVFAQYRAKYDEYVRSHDDYILSKKQYEQFKTLTSKENLQRDTQEMLIKRDEVLVLYYKSLISKMDDSSIRMPEERKNEYTQKYNDEITWLDEHKTQYKISDSPATLSLKSEEVDVRFQGFQGVLYKGLYYIARGKMEMYSERYNGLFNDLVSLTEKIKSEQRDSYKLSDDKIDIINRWFGEITLKNEEYLKLLAQADEQIIKAQGKSSKATYDGSIKLLNKAMDTFKDRLRYTEEIISEIKVSDSEN